MQFTASCRLYWALLRRPLQRTLANMHGARFAAHAMAKTKPAYRVLVKRAPDIGGRQNPLASNIYLGAIFIALYQSIQDTVDLDAMQTLITSTLTHSKVVKLACSQRHQTTPKYRAWVKRTAQWTQAHAKQYPSNWVMQENPSVPVPPNATYFEFTRCGLCELCKQEGCAALMPALCQTDFITANFGKSNLIRTQTLAQDFPCCNFLFLEKDA